LLFHNDLPGLIETARLSSEVTHAHPLALQGAALQATAVAAATRGATERSRFLGLLALALAPFEELGQDTTVYKKALARIAVGLNQAVPPGKMATLLGNGIKAQEAVPMATYCYLANPDSYVSAVEAAIFLGGDTDTIAAMTGAISGAALGEKHIPERWITRISETVYTPGKVRQLACDLYQRGLRRNFKVR
jgi:poly(ADP-ribose) glycohydrolase ARH3